MEYGVTQVNKTTYVKFLDVYTPISAVLPPIRVSVEEMTKVTEALNNARKIKIKRIYHRVESAPRKIKLAAARLSRKIERRWLVEYQQYSEIIIRSCWRQPATKIQKIIEMYTKQKMRVPSQFYDALWIAQIMDGRSKLS